MKELSVEEKAKRYDEAIERARKEYKNHEAFKGFCEMLVHIFPELKESEDEKIRKWLIALIKSNEYGSISNVGEMPCPKLNVLAWLEKQGNLMKALQISNARIGELIEENYYLREQLEKQGNKPQGKSALEAAKEEKVDNQNCVKPVDKVEPIIVRDFNSVFSREQVEEIDKRIEESQRLYNAKLRDAMRKVEDFPMTN